MFGNAVKIILLVFCSTSATYMVPNVEFKAFNGKGLRVSIPDAPGIKQFAFHGKLNELINSVSPGSISNELRKPTNGKWEIYFPNVVLSIGDVLNYWIFIQVDQFGYQKDKLSWTVNELIDSDYVEDCKKTDTFYKGEFVCTNKIIFDDTFENLNNWNIEKYIPSRGPNFEFNYYDPSQVRMDGAKVAITPKAATDESDLKGILDLTKGCTSMHKDECMAQQWGVFLLPPIKSGKITSKFSFRYGRIDIRAKLPEGDWIFPDISLVPVDPLVADSKIWIAYARGNLKLLANDGTDIGGNLLFGGPIINTHEPQRSENLVSKLSTTPFSKDMHTYTLIWEPKKLRFFFDNKEYGVVSNKLESFNRECFISIGLGVGGINDFPDNFTSSTYTKPWINKDRKQLKDFFTSRNLWRPTWKEFNSSLKVNYVRVTSLA